MAEEKRIIESTIMNEKEYWISNLKSNAYGDMSFPFDRNPLGEIINKESEEYEIETVLAERILEICKKENSKIFIFMATCIQILLRRFIGKKDLIIGTSIEKQNKNGEFINTILPIRNVIDDKSSFKEFLLQVREVIIGAIQNQNYSIERLLEDLKIKSNGLFFPLFDVIVLLDNIHEVNYVKNINVNFLILFSRNEDKLTYKIKYNSCSYDLDAITRIASSFEMLLMNVLSNLDISIEALEIQSIEDKNEFLYGINRTEKKHNSEKTIIHLFEEEVQKHPDLIVLNSNDISLTYRSLMNEVNCLYNTLTEKGVKSNEILGILFDNSIELIIAVLGVLKVGATYVPLDINTPPERINLILRDSGLRLLLTQTNYMNRYNNVGEKLVVKVNSQIELQKNPIIKCNGNDNAYIIYTSGTSGRPKGVIVNHNSLSNYIAFAKDTYSLPVTTDFPLFTSFAFDLSITSIFLPLVNASKIFIYNEPENELLIKKIILESRVNIIKLTPSHLKIIKELGVYNHTIKKIIVGGENFETFLANGIFELFEGNIKIYNEYGPTEATVGCMIHNYIPNYNKKSIPIGNPIHNTEIYLLDNNMQPVCKGAIGNIYVSGNGLAQGYLNNVELSNEKFIENPFLPGKKIYLTGDIGKRLENNQLEYLYRNDSQYKIRGFRIELEEIKQYIDIFQGIMDVFVDVKSMNNNGSSLIYAYLVTRHEIDILELRNHLSKYLPNYMIPSFFINIDKIPLTANGKVDLLALPDLNDIDKSEYSPPQNEIQEKLVGIWKECLEIDKIGIKDNYFSLGGDSIKSISIISRTNNDFNQNFELADLYQNDTIDKFSYLIETSKNNSFFDENYEELINEFNDMKTEFLDDK